MKLHLTPNGATWLMLTCATMSIIFLIAFQSILGFGIWIFITGIMDGVDGAIARLSGKGSKFGGFFDSSMDRVSEAVIYIGLLWAENEALSFSSGVNTLLLWVILLSSMMISYTRARIELVGRTEGVKFDTNIGLFARSERLFYLFIISILGHFFGIVIFSWGLVFFAALVFGTMLFRFFSYKTYLNAD